MNSRPLHWLQLTGLWLCFSLLISTGTLLTMRVVNGDTATLIRRTIYLPSVRVLESAPYDKSIPLYNELTQDVPSLHCLMWILSDNDEVIASNTSETLPAAWRKLPKPVATHEMSYEKQWNRSNPALVLIKLNKRDNEYVLFKRNPIVPGTALAYTQTVSFFLVSAGSLLSGLSAIFIYQLKNARTARQVLATIKDGNLKARFASLRFDQIGQLMHEFNGMADEIERLVGRLHETENAKRDLLQELSHDLRTPLTSLTTAVDALSENIDRMQTRERSEMLAIAQGELSYFRRLIEDLFFIADIESPHHRDVAKPVDLQDIVLTEIKAIQLEAGFPEFRSSQAIQWILCTSQTIVEGDPFLLRRLVKNSVHNAMRFAKSRIEIRIEDYVSEVALVIEDDGPGMSQEEIALFGQRRRRRIELSNGAGINVSLGLGSVIMKTIAELHGGSIGIESALTGRSPANGTRFTIMLRR